MNSSKGYDVINRIPNVTLKIRDFEEAIKDNDTLRNPTTKPESYNELFKYCKIAVENSRE